MHVATWERVAPKQHQHPFSSEVCSRTSASDASFTGTWSVKDVGAVKAPRFGGATQEIVPCRRARNATYAEASLLASPRLRI